MPRPRVHALTALALGTGTYLLTRQRGPALAAAATSVLVDADHLVDWAAARLLKRHDLFLVPFHGWEVALLLLFLGRPRSPLGVLGGAGIGLLAHLALDHSLNHTADWAYSLLYRVRHGFKAKPCILETDHTAWTRTPWWQWF